MTDMSSIDRVSAWEKPYKFYVGTEEVGEFFDGSCSGLELTAYGECGDGLLEQVNSCDFNFNYRDLYQQLIIPVNIYSSSIEYPSEQIESFINEANNKLNFRNVPFRMAIKSYSNFAPSTNSNASDLSLIHISEPTRPY